MNETRNYVWPDHYPERCPPSDAKDVVGIIYRFTNRANPKHTDFLSYYELKPNENWGDKACQARGLSVFTSIDDCKIALAAVPALRKKKLCVAELTVNAGVIAATPSHNHCNHKTLWSLIGAQDLAEIFVPLDTMKVAHA